MAKKHPAIKPLIFVFSGLLAVFLLWIGSSIGIYNFYFGRRFESNPSLMNHVYDFDGLERTRYEFESDKGQTLVGYMYAAGVEQKAIIVFAHGYGGGGHNSYMKVINYYAQNGFYVFAYDATGNDESGGKGIGGVPQGLIDLNYAITFVEKSVDFPDLPICLFGHSWGGYSACNVLVYHPEVKSVVECSGPCSSTDLLEGGGKNVVGPMIYILLPVIKTYEKAKFGEYAECNALNGFAATDAPVMVVHSSDDNIVPISYGYDIYYEHYKDDPRFVFKRLEGKGHNLFLDVDRNTELFGSVVDFYNKNLTN